jgi:hypothetical protein
MMAQRSILRADQLDSNDTFNFAKLVIDGYSGGDLQDGYLMGLVLQDGYLDGNETIRMDAHDGAINQTGTGQVTFSGNVLAKQTVIIDGDLTVQGTTTTIDTEQMIVTDPITVINAGGSEAESDWTGFTARDTDGYNRTGWVFTGGAEDGYWGLSTDFSPVSQPDAVPDRAIAYVGAGDAYGDLSSTADGDSGADKIAITPITGLVAGTVQDALEELQDEGHSGTNDNSFTINEDASAVVDEDVCLVYKGGDGTSLMEGYLCLITDSVGGTRFEFKVFDDGAQYDRVVHVGPDSDTSDVDACVVLNAGDGSVATSAELCMDGTADRLNITAPTIRLDGDIELGTGAEDCITFNGVVCSDIIPCCDDAYDFGSETKRWQDGYFVNLQATNFTLDNDLTIAGDLTVDGDTILGSDDADCIIFNGSLCSDIIPCCDDAYDLGDATHGFLDGYITNLESTNVNTTTITATTGNITTVNATDVNTTDVTATGDVTVGDDLTVTGETTFDGCVIFNGGVCSDIIPCCDDAYDFGDETHRWQDGYFVNLQAVNFTLDNNLTVAGDLTVDGDTILGSDDADCIIFNADICSDIIPCCDDAYQIGQPGQTWQDGYFNMPTFDNITPIGNVDSLIGVLKGIDDALASAGVDFPRGVYEATLGEAAADAIDSSRAADQGDTVDVGSLTDADFRDDVYIYWNGQLLYNDPTTAANTGAVQNDVARQTGSQSTLLFSGNLKNKAIIQIVNMS